MFLIKQPSMSFILALCLLCSVQPSHASHIMYENQNSEQSASFDLGANERLREGILTDNPDMVNEALIAGANPDFIPRPQKLSCMKRVLQKIPYLNTASSTSPESICMSTIIITATGILCANSALLQNSTLEKMSFTMVGSTAIVALPSWVRDGIDRSRYLGYLASYSTPESSMSPLILAATKHPSDNQEVIIRSLLDAKANISSIDADGDTALHKSVERWNRNNSPASTAQLLEQWAVVYHMHNNPGSPLLINKRDTLAMKLLAQKEA